MGPGYNSLFHPITHGLKGQRFFTSQICLITGAAASQAFKAVSHKSVKAHSLIVDLKDVPLSKVCRLGRLTCAKTVPIGIIPHFPSWLMESQRVKHSGNSSTILYVIKLNV